VETTKRFANRLDDTKKDLEQDYTEEEIENYLDDPDFATEFAETLHRSLNRLSKECDQVVAECTASKKQLRKVLTWY